MTMAADDADMRHRMNVEDEYFRAIEKRDTEILVRDHKIAEQEEMLRATIKMLMDAGKSVEEIAATLGKDADSVKQVMMS